MSFSIHGLAVARGIAIGRAVLVASSRVDVAHYFIDAHQVSEEITRLGLARDAVKAELQELHDTLPKDSPPELSAILEVHLMLLQDEMLADGVTHWIKDRLYNAEWALTSQLDVVARQFDEMDDAYLRERKGDLEQVVERVLRHMKGVVHVSPLPAQRRHSGTRQQDLLLEDQMDVPLVLVAHDLSPADMILFKQHEFAGFVTDLGGVTSHTAIVARSLAIPAIVGLHSARAMIRENELLIIDGREGVLIVNPNEQVLEEFRRRRDKIEAERIQLKSLRSIRPTTLDGQDVMLLANIELPQDVAEARDAGAMGIGLFRSEFLFLNRIDLPDEDEQYESYRQVVMAMDGLPVTIRTLDLGADKVCAGDENRAPNPALGLRAIRYCLSEPLIFQAQLRALLRASNHGTIRVLIPMLAHAHEIDQTLIAIAHAKAALDARGVAYDRSIQVGGMIEIPAAALSLGYFVRKLDFLSIGTNDLIQYTLAIDRSDDAVAHLYDPLHPAVLQLIAQTIAAANRAGKAVAVCGEMAGDLTVTRLLLGLGLREFSMHPAQLLAVKHEVLHADLTLIKAISARIMRSYDPRARKRLLDKLRQEQ